MTLAEFLLARIAEDEVGALAAEHPDGPETLVWSLAGTRCHTFDNGLRETYQAVFAGRWAQILVARDNGTVVAHIARWDPARVLAECEAKRRLITLWEDIYSYHDTGDFLETLALPYADHPDYRQEYQP